MGKNDSCSWNISLFVYHCTKAFVHMISYIHRFRLHIFRKSNAVPLPARTNAKLNYILLFSLTRTQFASVLRHFFSCLWRSHEQLCCITTAYQCTPHTCLFTHTHTFLSSGEATHWVVSLVRLLSSNHSEHDHATEQLHAHLWQTAGA